MVDLQRDRLPPAGRATGKHARPGRADHSEVRLEIRDQLGQDRVTIGAVVGGVHRVRIVEVRCGVLECDGDQPGKIGPRPGVIELRSRLVVVLREEGLEEGGCGRRVVGEAQRRLQPEMALLVDHGVACRGMVVVALGQQHGRAQIDRPTPERGQQPALDLDVLHPPRVRRELDRRDDLRQTQRNRAAGTRIDVD